MANRPFEYRVINPLERPKSEDLNMAQGQSHYDVRMFAYEIFGRQNGFLGYSFNPEPTSPASSNISIQQGVAFQFGASELAIGSIPGLNDSYPQKAVTIATRLIATTAAPTGVGEKRYDLIQIRALSGDERLTDEVTTDILDPALQSFTETDKFKTLTSSLTPQSPVYTVEGAAVTAPLSYVTGNAVVAASWNDVPKPAVATGYLGVAYIRRYPTQTAISAGDIGDVRTLLTLPAMVGGTNDPSLPVGDVLLSNGAAGITSIDILPMSKGGTGRAPTPFVDTLGSVAYLDTAGDASLKYTQAASVGSLLASNNVGAPTWIAPGAEGTVLTSTGTSWVAASPYYSTSSTETTSQTITTTNWSLFADLALTDVVLRAGLVRVRLQPRATGEDYRIRVFKDNTVITASVYLKFEIEDSLGATRSYVSKYLLDSYYGMDLTMPAIEAAVSADTYSIKVYAKATTSGSPNTAGITIENCDLFVSQG